MNILIVNDDGINSIGLEILTRALTPHGKIYVSAPAFEQSGASHMISLTQAIKVEDAPLIPGSLKTIQVHGSPADATRSAISLFNVEFDLVVSGINNGPNIARDVMYSGTVGAAKEAKLYGINAIAISADNLDLDYLYDETIKTLDEIITNKYYDFDGILNVNFPDQQFQKPKGVTFTKQGRRYYHSELIPKLNEDNVYYLKGSLTRFSEEEDSDVYAFENGYISITPLRFDRTDDLMLEKLNKLD